MGRDDLRVDRFNHNEYDPHEQRFIRGNNEDENYKPSHLDSYEIGLRHLAEKNIFLEADMDGLYAWHDAYLPSEVKPLPGYKPPKDFRYLKRIQGKLEENELRKATLSIGHTYGEYLDKFWSPLINPSVDKRRPLFGMAKHEVQAKKQEQENQTDPTVESLTLTGLNDCRRFVPQKEWFDERIQQVEAKDLLPLLPPSEMELFMLSLGRVMVGKRNSYTAEGTLINHSFRTMVILVGLEAGLGKSTLMNHLLTGLRLCGYRTEVMQDAEARFGWGVIANSDITYMDDLTPKDQKKLITNNKTKQLVSNGLLKVERKGVDATNTVSKTVIFACSNDWNQKDFYGMDSGLKSRIKLLYTRNKNQLKRLCSSIGGVSQGSPLLHTKEHWEWLADKLNTDTSTLALWLLHLCAEKFLATIGYERSINNIYTKIKNSSLVSKVKKNTESLQIQVEDKTTKSFIFYTRFMLWVRAGRLGIDEPTITPGNLFLCAASVYDICSGNKGGGEVIQCLEQDYINRDRPDWHPYLIFTSIDYKSIENAQETMRDSLFQKLSNKVTIKKYMNCMNTLDGFSLSGDLNYLQRYWKESFDYDKDFREVADYLFDNGKAGFDCIYHCKNVV